MFRGKPKLTPKQRAFVNEMIKNPKQTPTAAIKKTYNTTNGNSAKSLAYINMHNPAIISHLNAYNDLAEETITHTIIRYKDSDDIKEVTLANDNSKWIHDKIHGKATIRTENTNLNISIEAMLNELK
jgi:phage terminase small subunit